MHNNFSKNFKQAIQNQEPCDIVYVLLQIKLALSTLIERDETIELGLMDLIKGRRKDHSYQEMAMLKATETKKRFKNEVHRFAKEKELNTELFDHLDSKIIISLVMIALTTENLALELRTFMDNNPRRTGVNFTPLVIRQLMQRVLIELTKNQPQISLFDPVSRTGDLLFSSPPLPFSKIILNSERSFEREVATLFWHVVMLEQYYWQMANQTILQQTMTTTLSNPFQNAKPKKEKYDAVLSSIAMSTGMTNTATINAKTHTTLWVESILEILNDNGVAVLLVEDGFFHRTTFDYEFREHLVKQDLVEMVIALPANLFLKHAHFNASILVINKNKAIHAKNKVKLFHLHQLKELNFEEIKELVGSICGLDTNTQKNLAPNLVVNIDSLTVSKQLIIENRFSLRPLDYLHSSIASEQLTLDVELKKLEMIQKEWQSLEQNFRDLVT